MPPRASGACPSPLRRPCTRPARARRAVAAATAAAMPPAAARLDRRAFRARVRAGERVVGLFLNSASPLVAELMASVGWDFLVVGGWGAPLPAPLALRAAPRLALSFTLPSF